MSVGSVSCSGGQEDWWWAQESLSNCYSHGVTRCIGKSGIPGREGAGQGVVASRREWCWKSRSREDGRSNLMRDK